MEHLNFGPFAAILTTTAFLPQAFKVIRTKDTKSLSLTMYLFMFCGTVLWMLHGFNLNDKAIIYANIITSALNAVILSLKISDLLKEKEAKKKAS
jgi:MtN3 and saliva related transmembrane protein